MKSILITGFEPFLGESINPSQILLEKLGKDFSFSSQIETLLLPVSFDRAASALETKMQAHHYDVVLLLGQAGGRESVCLERVGLNWTETEKPDEDGNIPSRGEILADAPSALFTALPIDDWKERLSAEGHNVSISSSAGGYVCNYVYYKALTWLATQNRTAAVCFVHVPYLPEQTTRKAPGTPSMPFSQMLAAVSSLVALVV